MAYSDKRLYLSPPAVQDVVDTNHPIKMHLHVGCGYVMEQYSQIMIAVGNILGKLSGRKKISFVTTRKYNWIYCFEIIWYIFLRYLIFLVSFVDSINALWVQNIKKKTTTKNQGTKI